MRWVVRAVIPALILATGAILAEHWGWFFPGHEEKREEESQGGMLGGWERRELDVVYQADSDGFLVAYIGGSGASGTGLTLQSSPVKQALDSPLSSENCAPSATSKSRARGFQGTMIPVRKGDFYRVGFCEGQKYHITAHWIPLRVSRD